jgi:hypothetical protein
MSEDRIERETLIAAPLERVWALVAEPGFWVADKASLPGTVAREGESIISCLICSPHRARPPRRRSPDEFPSRGRRWPSTSPSWTPPGWFPAAGSDARCGPRCGPRRWTRRRGGWPRSHPTGIGGWRTSSASPRQRSGNRASAGRGVVVEAPMELLRVDRVAGFSGRVIGTVAARALERQNAALAAAEPVKS